MNIIKFKNILFYTLTFGVFSFVLSSCEREELNTNIQTEIISEKANLDELTQRVSNDKNYIEVFQYNYEISKSLETVEDITKIKPMSAKQLKELSTQLLINIPELSELDEEHFVKVFMDASEANIVLRACTTPYRCCIQALEIAFQACAAEAWARYLAGIYTYNEYIAYYNGCVAGWNFGIKQCPR